MKRFRAIATSDAREGMCLYEDVCDRAGNVLLPRQTALTEGMIRALQRRDIDAVLVADDAITPEQLAAERLRVQERLVFLWRHAGTGPASCRLREVVERYRMAELS